MDSPLCERGLDELELSQSGLDQLPDDCWLTIFNVATFDTIRALNLTCRYFRDNTIKVHTIQVDCPHISNVVKDISEGKDMPTLPPVNMYSVLKKYKLANRIKDIVIKYDKPFETSNNNIRKFKCISVKVTLELLPFVHLNIDIKACENVDVIITNKGTLAGQITVRGNKLALLILDVIDGAAEIIDRFIAMFDLSCITGLVSTSEIRKEVVQRLGNVTTLDIRSSKALQLESGLPKLKHIIMQGIVLCKFAHVMKMTGATIRVDMTKHTLDEITSNINVKLPRCTNITLINNKHFDAAYLHRIKEFLARESAIPRQVFKIVTSIQWERKNKCKAIEFLATVLNNVNLVKSMTFGQQIKFKWVYARRGDYAIDLEMDSDQNDTTDICEKIKDLTALYIAAKQKVN